MVFSHHAGVLAWFLIITTVFLSLSLSLGLSLT
jgi:hypothetical protein